MKKEKDADMEQTLHNRNSFDFWRSVEITQHL